MNTQLSETQKSILIAAAEREDHRLEWFPEGVNGGARAKVLGSLRSKGLIELRDDLPVISAAGLEALGLPPTSAKTEPVTVPMSEKQTVPDTPKARKTRDNTKQAKVIAMLNRPEGATLDQLVEATGWLKHTVRGALSILGKKQGIPIESSKTDTGRVYRAGVFRVE
jgi:hypothetical protein